jgi:hypothetical protein
MWRGALVDGETIKEEEGRGSVGEEEKYKVILYKYI